ncbi:hypothetical protein [Halalkalibacterium halodurans]|uniref:hypothetical protein n=1 Tax=Halalkalibacterium halodurans TaxID=86665 RepID=UPI0010FF27D1|nr:hypothetical protein [Halalkalibacterium halodurans]
MEMKQWLRTKSPLLKWVLRLLFAYVCVIVATLALAIISIFITFTFVIIDTISDSTHLGDFAEAYFVPVSEFLWDMFLWLVPGL